MKSRKYPTLQSALDDLKSKGKLEYKGHEGNKMIYTFQMVGHPKYILFLYDNGYVQLAYQVLRRE